MRATPRTPTRRAAADTTLVRRCSTMVAKSGAAASSAATTSASSCPSRGAFLRGLRAGIARADAAAARLSTVSASSCATGKHTQEKPAKPPAATPRGPAPMPLPLGDAARATGADGRASCIRCRQGFFCADHPAEPPAAPVEPPKPPVRDAGCARAARSRSRGRGAPDAAASPPSHHNAAAEAARGPGRGADVPQQGLRQQGALRAGRYARDCAVDGALTRLASPALLLLLLLLQFTERANADDACRFHPGPPIFHERQKGWQCCNKVRASASAEQSSHSTRAASAHSPSHAADCV